jgi:uncharacterized phage-like protein YoqJ
MKIIAVTGHRPDKLSREYDMKGPCSLYVARELRRVLDEEKPDQIVTGMALGVDMIFAGVGIQAGIKVLAAVPFIGQESRWPQSSQDLYRRILDHPLVETHVVFPGGYEKWKLLQRNVWMVDRSNKLIAVWNGDTWGGTYHCLTYAKSQGREVIRIDPRLFAGGLEAEKI